MTDQTYEPIELVVRGTDKLHSIACGKCGHTLYLLLNDQNDVDLRERSREWARKHCAPATCKSCGTTAERHRIRCANCEVKYRINVESEHFAKAKKITPDEYDGEWVFDPSGRGPRDGFFESLDALEDYCADEVDEAKRPDYVWACDGRVVNIDVDAALENVCEYHYSEARDELRAVEELTKAIDAWNEKQTATTYEPDYSRAIVLRKASEP